jgi:2-oxo-4-hydroxy-4-carboxy-5-ureidoimidazoline decarboxylase
MTEALIDVAAFDVLSPMAAGALLTPVCASEAWIVAMVATRPHGTLELMDLRSDEAIAAIEWPDVEQAMAAHPRIGERAGGENQESTWSRQEQATMVGGDDDVARALHEGNIAYEQRFGHVFLVCATGRTPAQMLAALNERLDNDEATERAVVRRELAAIVRLRLAKALRN